MQVDRPIPDDAAAGQRDDAAAVAGEQRSHHADRGSHPADEFVGCFIDDLGAGNADGAGRAFHIRAEGAEDLDHVVGVRNVGHAADDAVLAREDGGGEDGQRGVFGAGNIDRSAQGGAAVNYEFIHGNEVERRLEGPFGEGKTGDAGQVGFHFDGGEGGRL